MVATAVRKAWSLWEDAYTMAWLTTCLRHKLRKEERPQAGTVGAVVKKHASRYTRFVSISSPSEDVAP